MKHFSWQNLNLIPEVFLKRSYTTSYQHGLLSYRDNFGVQIKAHLSSTESTSENLGSRDTSDTSENLLLNEAWKDTMQGKQKAQYASFNLLNIF